MILRLSTILAATGLGLLSPSILVGARQLQRSTTLDREKQKLDGEDLSSTISSNSRLLLHRRKKAQQKKELSRRKLQSSQCKSIIAIDSISEAMSDDGEENDEDFLCELVHGVTLPIQGTKEQISQMRALLHDGTLVSNESTLEVLQEVEMIDGMAVDDDDSGEQQPAFSSLMQGSVSLPPGDVNVINSSDGRKLNAGYKVQFEGKSPVLVVKITDRDGLAVEGNADYISDKVFGTSGDDINPAKGFKDCSFGKFELTNEYSVDIDDKLSAPGVLEVDINISFESSSQSAIRSATQQAVETKLGFDLPGPFQQVMFLTENCYGNNCGWAAYAYISGWLSLYKKDNYIKPGVVLHEIGHNMGLAHSGGTDRRTYSDHTGLMGNPLWGDDKGKMCFNAAKNFQLAVGSNAWYNDGPGEILTWDSGEEGGTVLDTKMVGIAEFDKITDNNPVVIKLETGGSLDYFVGFNRATGATSQNRLASDLVTIYEMGNNGLSYSNSFLNAYLAEGESHTISEWRGTKQDLTITVLEINTNTGDAPGYAHVKIVFGDEPTSVPTNLPTAEPTTGPPTTPQPTANPVVSTPPPTANPVEGPFCGDGICDAQESPDDCDADCIIVDFKANNGKSNAKTNGLMFSLDAKEAVTLSSLDVEGKKDGASQVTVYALQGDYEGNEFNEGAWERVFDHSVSLQQNVATNIGQFDKEVAIAAGERVSLFVFSKNGLRMSTNTGSLRKAHEDNSLVMYDGLAFKKEFNKVEQNGQWSTSVKYYASSKNKNVEEMRISSMEEEETASVEVEEKRRSSRSRGDDEVVTAVKHHHHTK